MADAVVTLLQKHDSRKRLSVIPDGTFLTIEGPCSVFDAAKEAAQGRPR